jgi:hypothetical protein
VRPQRLRGGQGSLACGGGVGQPAGGQVDTGAQDRQRRLGRDAVQRLAVGGVQDLLRLVELAQVDKRGGKRQQRLDIARIRRDPGTLARGVTQ